MNSDSERDNSSQGGGNSPDTGPVVLTRVYDPVEAEIIVSKLRSAGIEAFLRHDALSVVMGLTVDGCGQQDVMVRAEDLEEARTALELPEEPDSAE